MTNSWRVIWVSYYELEPKLHDMYWKSPGPPYPKRARMSKSKVKTLLICFFECKGKAHWESVPTWSDCQQNFFISKFWNVWYSGFVVRGQNDPPPTSGSCTMIIHSHTANGKFCIKLCTALMNIITSNLHLYPSFLPPVDVIPYIIHPVKHPKKSGPSTQNKLAILETKYNTGATNVRLISYDALYFSYTQ
jgi:hypothetical protein